MPGNWARFGFATQFLIAIIAVFTLWSQVGGQVHLDMIPWYWKLGLGAGLSWTAVQATAAAMAEERAWNRKTLLWLGAALALAVCMAGLVYYYHLLEPVEEEEEMYEEETVACLAPPGLERIEGLPRV